MNPAFSPASSSRRPLSFTSGQCRGELARTLLAAKQPVRAVVPRRSREMTHLCSFKVTHTKNTIWRRARISEAISSTPQACGVVFHHPRRSVRKVPIFYEEFRAQVKPINRRDRGGGLATDLPAGKKPFLPGGKTATLWAWCWVAFGEQTMVISRECRSTRSLSPLFSM